MQLNIYVKMSRSEQSWKQIYAQPKKREEIHPKEKLKSYWTYIKSLRNYSECSINGRVTREQPCYYPYSYWRQIDPHACWLCVSTKLSQKNFILFFYYPTLGLKRSPLWKPWMPYTNINVSDLFTQSNAKH